GPILFLLIFNIPAILTRYYGLFWGYNIGADFINKVYKSGLMEKLSYGASIIGLGVVGAMTATLVSLSLPFTLGSGEEAQTLDQIFNTASKMLAMSGGQIKCPIVFRGPNASAGQLGAQHSSAFESLLANIPGIKVVSPSNGYDAKGLLKQAIRYEEDPVCFLESEVMYGDKSEIPDEEYYIPLGKADVKKIGKDVTIVSFNKMMKVALNAATELEKEGISAEVIDLRTIRPLDWQTILESVKKTNRLVIVEEQWPFASVSSEITYRIQKEGFDYLDAPIRRITSADAPMHYAPNLVEAYLPSVERTVKLVKEVMYLQA
ncbi:MAG TPA: transketolase C-terminal domain-containing protein, partial [Chitinophagaceae bacterium]|nr:transketolase C-terminal domain-containing protein [Chitinophagaceae bacterium]